MKISPYPCANQSHSRLPSDFASYRCGGGGVHDRAAARAGRGRADAAQREAEHRRRRHRRPGRLGPAARSAARTSWPCATWTGTTPPRPSRSTPRPSSTRTSARCSTRRRASTRWSSPRPTTPTPSSSMAAIKLGKHVYCEKPLTRTVYEARALAKAAREDKVATQMGNQGMAFEGNRLINEWLWDGAIGPVREVHVWSDRPTHSGKLPSVLGAGHRAAQGHAAGARRRWIGTCGSARPRCGPTIRPTPRSAGAAGGTSAPAAWATWASTTSRRSSPR